MFINDNTVYQVVTANPSVQVPLPVQAGSNLIVGISWPTASGSVTQVNDNINGGNYTALPACFSQGKGQTVAWFYYLNSAGSNQYTPTGPHAGVKAPGPIISATLSQAQDVMIHAAEIAQ